MNSPYRYVVTTGWWCVENTSVRDTRRVAVGSDEIRGASFFRKWHAAVDRFTRPVKILVVDSNSPTPPELPPDPRIELLRLDRNAGHPSNHTGRLSGVTLAHICGMTYAYCCDVDYWVYIEQDALIYGDGIVEAAIDSMKTDFIWGSGENAGQPIQQSMMIVKARAIPNFLKRLTAIRARDVQITPEVKFAIAASPFIRWMPEPLFYEHNSTNLIYRVVRRFRHDVLFRYAAGFDVLPFGYGRRRPVDFDDERFYFQHGTAEEIQQYLRRFDAGVSNSSDAVQAN
jgi:hypothetical protein